MNTTVRVRIVIYSRISEDPSDEAAGVARQTKLARELAALHDDWEIVAVIEDNDLSALRGGYRPGYAEVLRLVRLGKVDKVVVYQSSRLVRNRRERAEAIELFAEQRVDIVAVKGVSFDLTTAYGRGQAGLLGEFDTMESEVKAERVAAAAVDRAERGRPSGSLGYGWDQHGTGRDATWTINEDQAAIVREIVDRLLKGDSLNGITSDLNLRKVPPPKGPLRKRKGKPVDTTGRPLWGKTTVKKLALRESNIAERVHHRGRADEARYPGCWPPIIDEDKHRRVRVKLTDPARRTNGHLLGDETALARPGARRHLLTWGVGECGECSGWLKVTEQQGKYGKPTVLYTCSVAGCVGRNEAAVDLLVGATVVKRMSAADALDWLLGDEEEARRWVDKAKAIRAQLDDAADAFAAGEFTREQVRRINARLKPDLAAAEDNARQAATALDLDVIRPLAGPQAAQRWAAMPLTQKRAVLEALNVRVILEITSHRGALPRDDEGNPIAPGVRIEWRGREQSGGEQV